MRLRLGVVVLVLIVITVVVLATTPPPSNVPTLHLYVNDHATPHALLSTEVSDIEDLCFLVDSETTAEIAVLIVNTTRPRDINSFAEETFRVNGIGKEGLDNGVLILISTDERAWRIEVGYGLQPILTAPVVGRIGRDIMEPNLTVGNYYDAVYDGTAAVGQLILDEYVPPSGERPTPDLVVIDWRAVAIGIGVFILLSAITKGRILFWFGNIFKRGGFGGGRSGGGGARGRF